MQVDRTRADRAATGQTYLCLTESGEQRTEREHTRAHRLHEMVRCFEKLDVVRGDFVSAELRGQNGRTEIFEQAALRDQVLDVWNVVERDRIRGQQRGGEARQCRILRAADLDLSLERSPASNQEFIHPRKKSRSIGLVDPTVL